MNSRKKTDLKSLTAVETEAWAVSLGLEAFRGRQIRKWLFKGLADSFEAMTDLPKNLRSRLRDEAALNPLAPVKVETSADGSRKHLFKLADGYSIESVLIPERDHFTLCISSQAGCAMGCRFCLTARLGLKRNLTSSEIVEQVIQAKRTLEKPDQLTNIVFMGMGEPLSNYGAVIRAIGNLVSEEGMNFSHRKVTLSTCGLVPELEKMGRDVTVNLAVSLNAADDDTRSYLMPVNRTYPLKVLISACRDFPLPNRRMITMEYILIKDINDHDQDALNLVKLLSGLRAKINLIPLNPHPSLDLSPPPPERVLRFQDILAQKNRTAIIRKSKGADISAACGQLSGAYQKEP